MTLAKLDQFDLIDLVVMRGAGWQVADLAEHFGVHRATISGYLAEMGLTRTGPLDKCQRDHDMTDPDNVRVYKDGRRECKACKRDRDRAWQKKKYWESKTHA